MKYGYVNIEFGIDLNRKYPYHGYLFAKGMARSPLYRQYLTTESGYVWPVNQLVIKVVVNEKKLPMQVLSLCSG